MTAFPFNNFFFAFTDYFKSALPLTITFKFFPFLSKLFIISIILFWFSICTLILAIPLYPILLFNHLIFEPWFNTSIISASFSAEWINRNMTSEECFLLDWFFFLCFVYQFHFLFSPCNVCIGFCVFVFWLFAIVTIILFLLLILFWSCLMWEALPRPCLIWYCMYGNSPDFSSTKSGTVCLACSIHFFTT